MQSGLPFPKQTDLSNFHSGVCVCLDAAFMSPGPVTDLSLLPMKGGDSYGGNVSWLYLLIAMDLGQAI